MTVVVTGAAGFIGSNVVRALEATQDRRVLAVDRDEHERRFRLLTGSRAAYLGKDAFLTGAATYLAGVHAVVHLGACTDTTVADWSNLRRTNLVYSLRLLRACLAARVPLVYASSAAVYGTGRHFSEDGSCDAPTTPYGRSKHLLDRATRRFLPHAESQVVGLRFFNVYGPNEDHKRQMASMALQLHRQLEQTGVGRLFAGCDGFPDGEQRRDFVWIGDVVSVVRWFLDHGEVSGIFNVGTGRSRSFNELAAAVVAARGGGAIEYVPFPDSLTGRWQSFTEADLSQLRAAGYDAPFRSLEDGVDEYVGWLRDRARPRARMRQATSPPRLKRVLLVWPRGYCAGVERAVDAVRAALERFGRPLYVRRQLVHNAHVVAELEQEGAVFVRELDEVPQGAMVVFSAHGVAPSVWAEARERALHVIDTTCPLVTKVHSEVRHYAARGYTVLLVGHAGHDEVEGTTGEAPDAVLLVETLEDAEHVAPPLGRPVAYVTQTTLSLDDTAAIVRTLRRRFPAIEAPRKEDICYATTNRQRAVKEVLGAIDALLVVGSANSSNSQRLVEVGRAGGVPSYLVEDETAIDPNWLVGVETLGVTAGASAPETLVDRVLAWLRPLGEPVVEEQPFAAEHVHFALPLPVR